MTAWANFVCIDECDRKRFFFVKKTQKTFIY